MKTLKNPVNPSDFALVEYHKILTTVFEYESDTFSTTGSNLTILEAHAIAKKIMTAAIDNMLNDRLDGVLISCELDELRDTQ